MNTPSSLLPSRSFAGLGRKEVVGRLWEREETGPKRLVVRGDAVPLRTHGLLARRDDVRLGPVLRRVARSLLTGRPAPQLPRHRAAAPYPRTSRLPSPQPPTRSYGGDLIPVPRVSRKVFTDTGERPDV